jgi:hypothetical protein
MDLAQHQSWVNETSCGWLAKCRPPLSVILAGMVYNITSSMILFSFLITISSWKSSTMWLLFWRHGINDDYMACFLSAGYWVISWMGFQVAFSCAHKMTGLKISSLKMLVDAPESTFYFTLTKGEPSWQLSPTTTALLWFEKSYSWNSWDLEIKTNMPHIWHDQHDHYSSKTTKINSSLQSN